MKGAINGLMLTLAMMLVACGGKNSPVSESTVNPRDTVTVPHYMTGEDSIAYIENAIIESPMTAKDLLSLVEVHSIEEWLNNYNNLEQAKENPEFADHYLATRRDSAAMRLANRFMRMAHLVNMKGNASDKLQWAIAVNAVLDTFRLAMPTVPADSALSEIMRVVDKFSSLTQTEMNFQSYVDATVEYYRTIEFYRQWLMAAPKDLQPLAREEYEAWHDLNDARFSFWQDVSYNQEWYSMKPLEIENYYGKLAANRRAELVEERGIIQSGNQYRQKGKTVTTKEWEAWIKDNSIPEDIEFLDNDERVPSDSLVSKRVETLKAAFTRWLAARHAIAEALPKERGSNYDKITADVHSRMIGKLGSIIP